MKILFLTICELSDIKSRGIYNDLMREFQNEGHEVYIVSPIERRNKEKTHLIDHGEEKILRIRTLNNQKTSLIEKGISSLLIEYQYLNGIKKYFNNIKFDLVLYSTPPITFSKVVDFVKKRDNAFSYLLLKDIFPQNAIDLGFIKSNGFIHSFFKRKEKKLYDISDKIGCMSPANINYLRVNNNVSMTKLEENPNTIEIVDLVFTQEAQDRLREKYKIPSNKLLFIYGGNLGKPQGLDFLLSLLEYYIDSEKVYFLIVGSGTEYQKISNWFKNNSPENSQLIAILPKKDYDLLLSIGDVGMIFLDKRFSIPNFPSRLLSYLENNMPVLCITDIHTDIGNIIENNNAGLASINGDLDTTSKNIDLLLKDPLLVKKMGLNANKLLLEKYQVSRSYKAIIKHL